MANATAVQILNDGQRNTVEKLTGRLDTSDQAYSTVTPVIIMDPALLSTISSQGTQRATKLRIMRIECNIEDGLTVGLFWDVDGTEANAKRIEDLEGRLTMDYNSVGGLPNNAAGGGTGKIGLSTQGWSAGLTLSYSVLLWVTKA